MARNDQLICFLRHRSLVLAEHSLVELEHEAGSDAVRRTDYHRIARVTTWKGVPAGRIALLALLVVAPGLLMMLADTEATWVIGPVMAVAGILLILRYAMYGETTIVIRRGGKARTFAVVASRSRVSAFLDELDRRIHESAERFRAAQGPQEEIVVELLPEAAVEVVAEAPEVIE